MSSGATMLGAGAMLAGSRASLLSGDGATSLLSDGVDGSELGAELSATSAGSVSVAGAAAVESSMLRTSSVGKSLDEYGISASRSWMIGDKKADVDAGQRAQVRSVFLSTGKEPPPPGVPYYKTLMDAAVHILKVDSISN